MTMDRAAPERLDALVLLGCKLLAGAQPSAAILRRAAAAAAAFGEHAPAFVLASGGRRWYGRAEADVLSDTLVRLGVPERAVSRELFSLTTVENAWYSTEILREAGVFRVGVVTCDWHMPRALACFRAFGADVTAVPARAPVPSPVDLAVRSAYEWSRMRLDRRAASRWAEP